MDVFVQSWVRGLDRAFPFQDYPLEWLFLSMVFVKETLFHDMAERLIIHRQSSRPIVTDLPIEKRLLDDLHNQREAALRKLFSTLRHQLPRRLRQGDRCSQRCSQMLTDAIEKTVQRHVGRLDIDTITVKDAVRIFHEISTVEWFRRYSSCGTSGRRFCRLFDVLSSRGEAAYIIPVLSDYRPYNYGPHAAVVPQDPVVKSEPMDVDTEARQPADTQNTAAQIQIKEEPVSPVQQVASGDNTRRTRTPGQTGVAKMKIGAKRQKLETTTNIGKRHQRGGRGGKRGGHRRNAQASNSKAAPSA